MKLGCLHRADTVASDGCVGPSVGAVQVTKHFLYSHTRVTKIYVVPFLLFLGCLLHLRLEGFE